jgi:antitoxin ParD1/3/4
MNVSLTPELEKFVEKEVTSGLYQTASEVIRAGFRRLKEDQDARLPKAPATLEELKTQLLQSVERLDRGEGVDGGRTIPPASQEDQTIPQLCLNGNSRLMGIRSFRVTGFDSYLIFYRSVQDGIQVHHVYHGSRNLESLFGEAST